jgi:hypothetical protein
MKSIRSLALLCMASFALSGFVQAEEKAGCDKACEQKCEKACQEKCENKEGKAGNCECSKDKDGKACGTDKACCGKEKK